MRALHICRYILQSLSTSHTQMHVYTQGKEEGQEVGRGVIRAGYNTAAFQTVFWNGRFCLASVKEQISSSSSSFPNAEGRMPFNTPSLNA